MDFKDHKLLFSREKTAFWRNVVYSVGADRGNKQIKKQHT